MLLLVGVLGLIALWVWAESSKEKHRAKLAAVMLKQYKITGSQKDLQCLCDKLLTEEELLQQLLSGTNTVAFGSGGKLQLNAVPEFIFNGNLAQIDSDGKKCEVMRMNYGTRQMLRITEIGARGGSGKSIQIGEYELLMVLVGLGVIREDTHAGY
jgi:hypothetical protein